MDIKKELSKRKAARIKLAALKKQLEKIVNEMTAIAEKFKIPLNVDDLFDHSLEYVPKEAPEQEILDAEEELEIYDGDFNPDDGYGWMTSSDRGC